MKTSNSYAKDETNNFSKTIGRLALKFSPLILILSAFDLYFFFNFNALVFFLFSIGLIYLNKNYYEKIKTNFDIIELEVFLNKIILSTRSEDFEIDLKNIVSINLKPESDKSTAIQLEMSREVSKNGLWPSFLTDDKYIIIPEIFNAESIDIIEENQTLKKIFNTQEPIV